MSDEPHVVAFLQNQWFKNHDAARATLERFPNQRERLCRAWLFMGCLTGQRLKRAFGDDWCLRIIWENASDKIGGASSSCFPPDPDHIKRVLAKFNPIVVLLFGKVAKQVEPFVDQSSCLIITGMHPAARRPDVRDNLRGMALTLSKHILKTVPE